MSKLRVEPAPRSAEARTARPGLGGKARAGAGLVLLAAGLLFGSAAHPSAAQARPFASAVSGFMEAAGGLNEARLADGPAADAELTELRLYPRERVRPALFFFLGSGLPATAGLPDPDEFLEESEPALPTDVPAALEQIAPLAAPSAPELRSQVEQELHGLAADLPLTLNERVLSVVGFFQTARGRRILQNGLRRAGRYRELIFEILDEEGVPRDLIYLAQAESAFQPHARSRARAVGLWQFVSFRAREYGLQVDWWVDERRDPLKSTRAAARHLRDLHQQFGDWHLALAAYNSGPGRVTRALARARTAPDYWELVERRLLPRQTRNYVPIILALALVAKDPGRYGVEVEPDPPVRFETVEVPRPTELRHIAEAIGVELKVLQELNPHVLRGITPRVPDSGVPESGEDGFLLYVPPGTAETLAAALPQLPEAPQVLWHRHLVRRGDTLSGIAARYDTSATAIARANRITLRSLLHPGDVLVIPDLEAPRTARAPARREPRGPLAPPTAGLAARASRPGGASRAGVLHRVQRGETLWELSRRYRVSVSELRDANPYLDDRELQAGDRLRVPQ